MKIPGPEKRVRQSRRDLRGPALLALTILLFPGPAAAAGIQPGDIVLSANGRPVRDVEDLRAAVTDSKELVALLVQRGSSRIFVPVELA